MNKLTKLILLYLLPISCIALFLLPEHANAAIFNPPNSDKSVEYLGVVFGGNLGGINLGLHPDSSPFLGHLFQIFNGIVLAVAILVLSYVSIISTINTAQEGQVMGKKWSSIWIPLRSALGLLLLAPVPGSGYSLLQVTLMWIVLNGIGAADKIWNFVLINLANGVSVTQSIEINGRELLTLEGEDISKNLLFNLVCLEIIKEKTNNQALHAINAPLKPVFINKPLTNATNLPSISGTLRFGANDSAILARQNICGQIDINTSLTNNDLTDSMGNPIPLNAAQKAKIVSTAHGTKITSLRNMISIILPVAERIAKTKPDQQGNIVLPTMYRGLLRDSAVAYQKAMSGLTKGVAMALIGSRINAQNQQIPENIIAQGQHYGWITAGSFYYLFSQKTTQNLLSTALDTPNTTATLANPFSNNSWFPAQLNHASLNVTLSNFTPYINALNDPANSALIDELFDEPQYGSTTKKLAPDFANLAPKNNTNPILVPIIKEFINTSEAIVKSIQNLFDTKHSDPLISLATFGIQLMQLAENCWSSIIITSFIPNVTDNAIAGANANMLALISFAFGLLPAILAFVAIIWAIGATFAIYTPMVPYMIFIVTALSWFMVVIEAIVAAPIVALGLIAPAQDELGKIVPALGIIANIFLKPILMIIGLIMSAKLYKATIEMVNFGFEFSFSALQAQTGASIFSWLVMMVLYTAFIVTLINKCYSLIYQLPDKVLRWIGVTGEPTDVSSVKETQQSFDQQAKQVAGPAEGFAANAANKLNASLKESIAKGNATPVGPQGPGTPPLIGPPAGGNPPPPAGGNPPQGPPPGGGSGPP